VFHAIFIKFIHLYKRTTVIIIIIILIIIIINTYYMRAVESHVDLAIVLPYSRHSFSLQLIAYTQTNDSLPDAGFLLDVLFDCEGEGITGHYVPPNRW
jgi:hypothetical protein